MGRVSAKTAPIGGSFFQKRAARALHEPSDKATIARRREVAALGNWDTRVYAMSALIENALKLKAGR